MYNEYKNVSLEDLKKEMLFKRIKSWTQNSLTLEDGTVVTIEMTDYDCCASAGGEFKTVNLEAIITDVVIKDKGSNIYNGDGHDSYAEVIVYHNQNEIALADCYANNGNGGYYFSVCSLVVKDLSTTITQC